jgi:hypothetical protein
LPCDYASEAAGARNLHRKPALAARGREAATVHRVSGGLDGMLSPFELGAHQALTAVSNGDTGYHADRQSLRLLPDLRGQCSTLGAAAPGAPNWSANVKYQYYNFGNASSIAPPALVTVGSFTTDDHTVKASVNYRFNWGVPVAAGY